MHRNIVERRCSTESLSRWRRHQLHHLHLILIKAMKIMQEKTLLCSRETERDNTLCAGRNLIFHWREIYRLHIKFSCTDYCFLFSSGSLLTVFIMVEQCDNKQEEKIYTLLLNSFALLSLLWSSAIRLISSTNLLWATCPSLSLLMKQLRDAEFVPRGLLEIKTVEKQEQHWS